MLKLKTSAENIFIEISFDLKMFFLFPFSFQAYTR